MRLYVFEGILEFGLCIWLLVMVELIIGIRLSPCRSRPRVVHFCLQKIDQEVWCKIITKPAISRLSSREYI